MALHEAGVFARPEWTAAPSGALRAPGGAADGSDHHARALSAWVGLLEARGIAAEGAVGATARAWRRAARATPHARPVTLDADPAG